LNPAPSTSGKPFHGRTIARYVLSGLLLAVSTLALSSCYTEYYKFPQNTFAGRPIPPSKLAQRVMISYTANGSSGGLAIVDALRDIRSNVEDTITSFSISGYSSGFPISIMSFPAETRGYVYSTTDGSLQNINYSTESTNGSAGTFQSGNNAVAVPQAFTHIYGAEEAAGILEVIDNITGRSFGLNLPNVFQVAANSGDTVALAMVRNSNILYRIFKLNANQYTTNQLAITATGSVDCEPTLLPVYCVAPVPGTYDRPAGAYFSLDGTTVYVLNCGPECGGTTSSVTLLQQGPLNENVIPSSPISPSPVITNVLVPGGATDAISDGTTLYLAGQSQHVIGSNGTTVGAANPLGLFGGYLTTMNLATNNVTAAYSISDGSHSKMLFADGPTVNGTELSTLWIGSQQCGNGVRQNLFAAGNTTQAANYNCLTMVTLGSTLTTQIVPAVNQSGTGVTAVPVGFPNENNNQYYYGSLTGLCWVQNFNKVYTAYGGQVHVFSTVNGSEIDNSLVTVQGTALDVAYMDALSDAAN
jgi:hypothetical protein